MRTMMSCCFLFFARENSSSFSSAFSCQFQLWQLTQATDQASLLATAAAASTEPVNWHTSNLSLYLAFVCRLGNVFASNEEGYENEQWDCKCAMFSVSCELVLLQQLFSLMATKVIKIANFFSVFIIDCCRVCVSVCLSWVLPFTGWKFTVTFASSSLDLAFVDNGKKPVHWNELCAPQTGRCCRHYFGNSVICHHLSINRPF